jgi:hypothetical protein
LASHDLLGLALFIFSDRASARRSPPAAPAFALRHTHFSCLNRHYRESGNPSDPASTLGSGFSLRFGRNDENDAAAKGRRAYMNAVGDAD